MSCTQANIFCPNLKFGGPNRPSRSPYLYPSRLNVSAIHRGENHKLLPRLVCTHSKHKSFGPICATGNTKSGNEGFSWELLKKNMEQDGMRQRLLKGQKLKQEFGGNGGDGGRHGGGKGGGGSGGQEDGGLPELMDEILQVVLATINFIVVSLYLVRGAELTRLTRDYIKYLTTGIPSTRMIRVMEGYEGFKTSIISGIEANKEWLARVIATMLTFWHNPEKLVESMRECHANILNTVEAKKKWVASHGRNVGEASKEWLAQAFATMLTWWHNQRKLVELTRSSAQA